MTMDTNAAYLTDDAFQAWERDNAMRQAAKARLERKPDGDWLRIDAPSARRREIIEEVCQKYALSHDQLMGRTRKPARSHPRQELMYRLITECGWSLPRCGQFFNKHHTTCLHGARAHAMRNRLPYPQKRGRRAA